jgi:hypothetical protein
LDSVVVVLNPKIWRPAVVPGEDDVSSDELRSRKDHIHPTHIRHTHKIVVERPVECKDRTLL